MVFNLFYIYISLKFIINAVSTFVSRDKFSVTNDSIDCL